MSQFDEIVKNIALENEKCNYNPETDTNWGKLRWKMQEKCSEHMDYKTRIRLSQTSRSEKFTFDLDVRNFKHIVATIASESKKSNYNPKIDMNWCNLSKEMRNECLKQMDFGTRTRLSATSKSEKSLVEAKKFQFHRLHIDFKYHPSEWKVTGATKFGNRDYKYCFETGRFLDYGFISAVLKNGEVKNFRFYATEFDYCPVNRLLCRMMKFVPFRFERVSLFCIPYIDFFVTNCPNLKKIDLRGGKRVYFPFKKMLDIPSITNINEFRMSHVDPLDLAEFLNGLVHKWIDNDVEAGKSVQCFMELLWKIPQEPKELVDTFAAEFADRIIDKTAEEVRIRMDNSKTQILMRSLGTRKVWINTSIGSAETTHECFSCKVVPIDLPKSEYGIGDEWIQSIFENNRKLGNVEDQEVWGRRWA